MSGKYQEEVGELPTALRKYDCSHDGIKNEI